MVSDKTQALAKKIRESSVSGKAAEGKLETNDRIIARVTDGIYREPWSAFRELVSNAYDADATNVSIDCDYPYFNQIRISDNGNGMDSDTVADLLTNIGGSSKRTARGKGIGTVDPSDPTKSPAGRKLIGKIGIGLFAVVQLTQHFQIISKRKGSNERVSATVRINTYREDTLVDVDDGDYESGTFKVVSEMASDLEGHGTTIVLMDVRQAVREKLQSLEIWQALDEQEDSESSGLLDVVSEPAFHIGRITRDGQLKEPAKLPWNKDDDEPTKFRKLFEQTASLATDHRDRADLSHLDNYLKMLWRLSLGSPLRYYGEHPFDMGGSKNISFFKLSNKTKGSATSIELDRDQRVRQALGLEAGVSDPLSNFNVFVDGVQLFRPVQLVDELIGSRALEKPLLFVGKVESDFGGATEERSGGKLSFEAYLYWNSKIIPKESIGALIRVNGASGTLFDPDFLGYQIAEQNRKKQVTCEIFVLEGLDGALNIDRESYNTSHPHYLFIQKWLHSAFRQFATRHKAVGREVRQRQLQERTQEERSRLRAHSDEVWDRMRGRDHALPNVETEVIEETILPTRVAGSNLSWESDRINKQSLKKTRQIEALTIVLEAYGVLEALDDERRSDLIYDIISIFENDA